MMWWYAVALAGPIEVAQQVALPDQVVGSVQYDVLPHGGPADSTGLGPRGATVRITQQIDGLPVDISGAVWLRPDGTVRARRMLPSLPVDRLGDAVNFERAVDAAGLGLAAHGRLSWQPVGGVLRRVWSVDVEQSLAPRWTRPLVRVDAVSGQVLTVAEGAITADVSARAYPNNPVVDGAPIDVTLDLEAAALSDDRLEVDQCLDLQSLTEFTVNGVDYFYHVCSAAPAAEAVDGAFPALEVPYSTDPARDEDDFVASNLFWTVDKGLDWFTDLGWAPLPEFQPRVTVTANNRLTDTLSVAVAADPGGALLPYDNAYSTGGYLDWEDNWVIPRLVFGQGTEVDFGYDADVTHHELAHYIVKSQDGPSFSFDSDYGTAVDGASLNEGLADYFSGAIQGEGVLGEYSGGTDREFIRSLDGYATCSADRRGESHSDGQPFAQGLWALRSTLSADDARILDQAVLDSLVVIGRTPTFTGAHDILLAAVDDLLGPDVSAALAHEWVGRGFPDCAPVRPVTPSADEPFVEYTTVPYFSRFSYDNFVPGPMQFVVEVPNAGDRITLRLEQGEDLGIDLYGNSAPVAPLVVGASGGRITWEPEDVTYKKYGYDFIVKHWTGAAQVLGTMVDVGVAPSESQPDRILVHSYELTFEAEAAGPLVFQFANDQDGYTLALYNVGLTLEPGPESDGSTADTGILDTTETTTGSDDDAKSIDKDESSGGCGCASDGGSSLSGFGLWGARRR